MNHSLSGAWHISILSEIILDERTGLYGMSYKDRIKYFNTVNLSVVKKIEE